MAKNWQADASTNQSLSQKQDESKDQHLGGAGMNDQMACSNIRQMDYAGNSSYDNNGITSIPSTSNIVTPNSNTYNCNGNNNNSNIAWVSNSNGNFYNNATNKYNNNNNNINYNNNNNNINNNNNNNYNDNTGDRSNSMTILDGCVCISSVICIILGITALISDTLTIHSFEYCIRTYSVNGSYPYDYSYSCNHMCEIEYGMHQFRVVDCDKESFESTDYYTLCTSMTSSALYFPLYCALKVQGDIYEKSTITGLVSHILALLIFILLQKHIRSKHCNCPKTIFVLGMVVTLLASPVALGGWQINNDINGFTGMYSYSYVKNKETAWGISLWCTVIIMAFNVFILIMTRIICIYNKVRAKSCNNNTGIKSARQEATRNETVRLNNGAVNMPPQIVNYNNNNNNNYNNNGNYVGNYNNQSPYGWAQRQSYPQQSQFQQQQQQPQQQY